MYKNYLKRVLDFTAAFIGLVLLSPVFILLTVLLGIANKGKPFFTQDRPGFNAHVFYVLKFRTMNNNTDKSGNLLPDHERLTALGSFIRKTSLDEIPQLINIIKGDMSLIGPRPLRTFYLPFYTKREQKRHHVRPGITGLAQISGRNFIDWDQRFAYDITYVDNLSFSLDLKIFYKTILKVIRGSDVSISNENVIDNFDVYRQKQIDSGKVTL